MGNSTFGVRNGRLTRTRLIALAALAALVGSLFLALPPAQPAVAASPCGVDVNAITCENREEGTDPEVWDIQGAGDDSIQGFATDISVNAGSRIDFKVDTDAADYDIDIYRTGWYQGLGARLIDSVEPTAPLPQVQPECRSDIDTELYDCGTWAVSASWNVPADAVSGVYLARLERADTGGASHIMFIVRRDGNTSDVLFQTSDPTWHAYNAYGGSNFYQGAANGRAYKISYNRPFATREGLTKRDFYFSSEYATVRFLERNGYDMSYIAGVDTDRRGGELLNHEVFLSVGHDEYWSGAQRANIEAARDAGVHMQFLTGNEGYWRTRYEPSTEGQDRDYRTLVSYKETWGGGDLDPSSEWTGTWRDPRYADASQGAHLPENAVTGTMYMVNSIYLPVTVNSDEGRTRLWRNTGLSELAAGATAELADQTVGYESNEDVDNGFRPEGLIRLSTTVGDTREYLTDYGNTVAAGTTKHHVTLYKAESDALVFSAASVQWGWGLDSTHDGTRVSSDERMQQAQVNLLADMGAQPGSLMEELVAATPSSDSVAPATTITSPANGQVIAHGTTVTVTGTATDSGGRVAGVEVSTDGGDTWHPATGTASWSYSYIQQGFETAGIIARAIDDSANFSRTGVRVDVGVQGPYSVYGSATPVRPASSDTSALELGQKFTPEVDGYITGVRFYKSAANTGTHTGTVWSAAQEPLASVTFVGESPTGWQTALFDAPLQVTAGTPYVVSYTAPQGGYAFDDNYWPYQNTASSPLAVAPGIGAQSPGLHGAAGEYPWRTAGDSNYYVDAVFEPTTESPVRLAARTPSPGAASVPTDTAVTAVFTRGVTPGSVSLEVATAGGDPVVGTMSYDAATRVARFAPAEPLAAFTDYVVTVQASPTDGTAFDPGEPWTFRTAEVTVPEGQCPCSLYTPAHRPLISSDLDTASVTVGTRFTVSEAGVITGIRFFKGSANVGTHTGNLWLADGTEIGSLVFSDETASGWQSATFDAPIGVEPGQEYIVSYVAPGGRYAVTPAGHADPFTRGPLTAVALGGAYTYDEGEFPGSRSDSSYLVDVVFERSVSGPALASTTPAAGAADVARAADITATFSEPLTSTPAVTVTADGAAVTGTTTRSPDGATITFDPAASLPAGANVTVRITGIVAASGAGHDRTWTFRVAPDAGTSTVNFFGTTTPAAQSSNDGTSVELGMAFTTSVAGQVTALRFYKAAGDTGVHTGTLWAQDGREIANVVFQGESASGWQRAELSAPVTIEPGQTYMVSYLSPQGRYVHAVNYFTAPVSRGPLTATTPGNGTFRYGSGGERPASSWQSSNYFVDVDFRAGGGGAPVPTISGQTPTGTAAATDAPVRATVSMDVAAPTLTLSTGGADVAGSSSYNAGTRTLTFTPQAPSPPRPRTPRRCARAGRPWASGPSPRRRPTCRDRRTRSSGTRCPPFRRPPTAAPSRWAPPSRCRVPVP